MHTAGSPVDPSPVASSSQIRLEDSGSATSPGADSDLYYSTPNTPADTSGARPEGLDWGAQVRTRGMRLSSVDL
jgi:hypothetical protein